MSEIRIFIDDFDSAPADDLLENLLSVVRRLTTSTHIDIATSEIVALVQTPQTPNLSRFVDELLELSKAADRSFTAVMTLNPARQERLRKHLPVDLINTHVVHIRPGEEAVVRTYFQLMLGET
jgi:hypothetical protein